MRKEVIIAILSGLSLGLIVVFGVRTARHSLEKLPSAKPTPLAVNSQNSLTDHTIFLTKPEPDEIVSDSKVNIIGTTTPGSMVTAIAEADEAAAIADDTGAFSTALSLSGGPNIINIQSFAPNGTEAKVNFTVVVSSADLNATASAVKNKSEEKTP